MPSAAQKANNKLIAFHFPNEMHAQLAAEAQRQGFRSVSAYARAIAEHSLGNAEINIAMQRVGALRAIVQKNAMRTLFNALRSLTIEDLLADEGGADEPEDGT